MPRQLVVNADDFGLTTGVNDGICDAHDLGILTSASLFANAEATANALRLARSRPSLGVGVHLALVDGRPVLSADRIPTLVGPDGRFHPSWKPFIAACLKGEISLDDVERELTAQIERLAGSGLPLTHLDAHKHVHAYPPVFAIVARLAVRFGIPVVRVPYERWSMSSIRAGTATAARTALRNACLNAAMWPWARCNYRTAASLGLLTPRLIGRIHTGVLDRSTLHALLRAAGPGTTELMVHPGYVDAALGETATRLRGSRAQEIALLCDIATRAVVFGERLELVRHDLSHSRRRSLIHAS